MDFSKEDFTQENATRIMVIVMTYMNKPPLTHFKDLSPTHKTKFNRLMNEYIQGLGKDWQTKLIDDFNRIVNEDILNEDFDAGRLFIRHTVTDKNLLISAEQEEWIKEETFRTGEAPLI